MTAAIPPWRLGHRPGLDGLRGIAIALVLINHSGWPVMGKAGAVGVNLFFVLSGFLITRLLLEEREDHGRVSLRQFYARRSLRLFPAMYATLAVTAAVAIWKDLSLRPIAAAGLYVLNVVKASGMDVHLVTHTWSLSMEEQFYVVWPAVLLAALARQRPLRAALSVCVLGIVASSAMRVGASLSGASLVYLHNSPALAAGVLLAGCLLALAVDRLPGSALTHPLVFGLSAIVLLLASLGPKSVGLYLLGIPAVTLASVCIIALLIQDDQPDLLRRAMAWRPLVALGRVSYGLYLWHFVVFKLVRDVLPWPWVPRFAVQVAAALLVAGVSYRCLEQPFLRRKDRFRPTTQPGAGAAQESSLHP